MELKIQAVHQRLDSFERCVLAHPAPTIDITNLQEVVVIVRANVYNILHTWGP